MRLQRNAVELQVGRRRIEANESGLVFCVVSQQGREGAGGHKPFSHQTITLQRNTQTAVRHARQSGKKGTADRGQA